MDNYFIGIDVGGTMIKGALFDSRGKLIKKDSVATQANKEERFFENIVSLIHLLQKGKGHVAALGIGLPGVLDKERETLIESPNLPNLHNVQIKKRLTTALDIPVFFENDANIAALGELWTGAGKGLTNFLLCTLGTGIGSGLILNGNLWTGEEGKAGEFGHMIVNPDGARCACGKRGCLEAHSSGTAITRMAKEALKSNRPSSLLNLYKGKPETLTPKIIYNEAKKGDALCLEIYMEAARYLAIGISSVNNLLDLHYFIVGGGVSKAFDIFENFLLQEIRKRVFTVSKDKIRILVSKLGNDAGIFGAGYLAKKSIC